MRALFTSFARNTVFANIVLMFIFCGGYLAITQLSRETFPDIELDMIRVAMVWPGADPEEVEEGISRRIEEAVDGLEGIREFHTVSGEHVALALMEVQDGYDIRRVKEEVRNAIDTIATFPASAESPVVEEFIIRHSVMMLSLTGPEVSKSRRKYAGCPKSPRGGWKVRVPMRSPYRYPRRTCVNTALVFPRLPRWCVRTA